MSPVDFSLFIYHVLLQLRCVCDTSISLRKSRRAFLSLRESAMGEVPFVETRLKIMRMNTSINLFASICIILVNRWNMKHMCRRFVHVADGRAIIYGPSLQKWGCWPLRCCTVGLTTSTWWSWGCCHRGFCSSCHPMRPVAWSERRVRPSRNSKSAFWSHFHLRTGKRQSNIRISHRATFA